MFCDGECTKGKNKRCGLYRQMTMEVNKKVETYDMCVFMAQLESQLRLENGNIRLQASIESSRNEQHKKGTDVVQTIANGFLGVMHTVNENSEEAIDKFKNLKNISKNAELKLIEIKNKEKENKNNG